MPEDINTWFNSFDRLQSVAVGAAFFYLYVVLLTRVLGKRTTSQMNNFDWIVTVAVGSLAGGGILLKDVSIADAAVGILVLGGLQWLTTWWSLRSEKFAQLIKGKPRLLVHKGQLQERAMRKERIARGEVYAALREAGFVRPADANWLILENDGKFTVIPRQAEGLGDADLLNDVVIDGAKGKEQIG
jgi:uncharacterized membrane protein YcaP (DUF421 family)